MAEERDHPMIYTDGSTSARDKGHPDYCRSGAGIFRSASSAGPRVDLCVDPSDYNTGVANTIQRAALVGIYKALQTDLASPDLLICTDSLSSMYMIDKHMRCPSLYKECKHEELLSYIVEAQANKAREGVHEREAAESEVSCIHMFTSKAMKKRTSLHTRHAYLNGATIQSPRALRSEKTFAGLTSMA